MFPVSIVITTPKGTFSQKLNKPSRQAVADAIEKLHVAHDEEIVELRAEMPYVDQGEEHLFTYVAEEPGLSADEYASWIWGAIEEFRY